MSDLADDILADTPTAKKATLGKIAELLDRNGIDLDEVGRVNRINLWQGFSKDADGEVKVTDLVGIQLSPGWEDGPAWPVVQQAKPCTIRPTTSKPQTGRHRLALIPPDPQIGYRRDSVTGELVPFHDERAMDVFLQVVRAMRPDLIVNLGDFLDLPEQSKYRQEPGFALTTQAALDRAHRFLAEQRANAPHAEIRVIEGNHDRRLANYIIDNAKAAFGLRRANTPDGWPVLSVPYLLRMDELNVEYVEGYPAGITWINDRLACIHGEKLKVSQVVDDERVSVIQGHMHRIELSYKTRRTRAGAKTSLAASPGCLCRIDGAVPSTKGSTDSRGRPVLRAEDWQQGFGVVRYTEGDGPFRLDLVPIINGWCMVGDNEYRAA